MSKLHTIDLEIDINASKAEVWDLTFNRFGEVNLFNPLIEQSHHQAGNEGEVGCERKCEITPGNWVHEKITSAEGTNQFHIEILEGGLPMMGDMSATFKLGPITSDRTNVSIRMFVNTKPAFMIHLMKGMIKSKFRGILIGLKYHLETGGEVTKKNFKGINSLYGKLRKGESFGLIEEVALA